MNKKRIVVFIPTIKAGGAEKQAALLASSLSKFHLLYFVSFYGRKDESPLVREILEEAQVNIIYLRGNFINKTVTFYSFLKDNKINVCFNYITLCDVLGCLIEKLAGVKLVYNGIRNSRLAPIKFMCEWIAHNYIADYTVFNCYSGAKYFANKGFSKRKIKVISNCFPHINAPIVRDNLIKKKRIITIARFQPQKDYETAVHAIAETKKYIKDFEFIIIGHGRLEPEIRKWVKDYNLEDCTTIYVAPHNVQEILKSADVYLCSSLYEGTSNSIMEAMNWSLPIVATNVGDNNLLIQDNYNGYLVEVGEYIRLARSIVNLLENDQLRIEMGLRGNERLHLFSLEHFVANYSKLLGN